MNRAPLINFDPHDDVIKWKHFPRYWPSVRGIHRSSVNSPYKGQWRGALMFSLICVWINGWANNREAGDLRRYRAHYDVTVMQIDLWQCSPIRQHGPNFENGMLAGSSNLMSKKLSFLTFWQHRLFTILRTLHIWQHQSYTKKVTSFGSIYLILSDTMKATISGIINPIQGTIIKFQES